MLGGRRAPVVSHAPLIAFSLLAAVIVVARICLGRGR
jgi:hypothetical protein